MPVAVIRMGDKPLWEQIGSGFVQHYYQVFDADRSQLGSLYIDASCLSWEGQQFQGKTAIVEKIIGLPFRKIQHSITAQDHQPTPDSCILSMVVGQLQKNYVTFSIKTAGIVEDSKNPGQSERIDQVQQG
ncbi:nuclear transport factor 2 isoform X7 [Scyliorhinus torazame]|uniref:nuclear transport factor 2 isoform X7 n=1 Tax=Scyliorhinus torazame TaxID=75743 RepID=UPI003B58D151